MNSQLVDKKGRVWQERTVIVKKDSKGFGFTLSREMPVFVDKVFTGTSAHKAGILEGDRIMKVNGTEVVGHKHGEVVDMIRDSTHVTLTIIGTMNGGTKTLRSGKADNSQGIEISTPRHLQELTQQSLKSMLQKQRKVYDDLSVEFSKEQAEKVEKELRDCENIIKILEEELAAKTPAIDIHLQTTSSNIKMLTGKSRSPPQLEQLSKKLQSMSYSRDDTDVHDGPMSPPKKFTTVDNPSPKPSRSHTFSISNGSQLSPGKPLWRSSIKAPGEDSDDDLSDEVASDAGPFSSLQELKGHPAHLAVFLHYLYLTKDPKHLLFFLVTSSYQNNLTGNNELLRTRGMDIFWTFFLDQSPLPLDVEQGAKERMLSTLENSNTENKLRSVFVEVRESLTETIVNDLGNYRHKRVIGLAGMFNDHLLSKDMTKAKHIEVVLLTLVPDLKQLLDDKSSSGVLECVKNHAIAACMATFVMDLLAANKGVGKTPTILERVQSFTKPDILLKKPTKKKKTMASRGHSFQLTSFKSPTTCDQCGKFLWGVVYHGFQCSQCAINLHRYCCITELAAECAGQQKTWASRPRRSSTLLNRKQSLPNMYSTTEETNLGKLEGVGSTDHYHNSRLDDPDDKQSPPTETAPSPSFESSLENSTSVPPVVRRDRSISDPHTNSLLLSDSEVSVMTSPNNAKEKIKRTNSEKLPSKPETLERNFSNEGISWSSEDSQLGKQGSLEAIVETPSSSNSKLAMVDEDIMKLPPQLVSSDPTSSDLSNSFTHSRSLPYPHNLHIPHHPHIVTATHTWLCNGRLLCLQDPTHPDNLIAFQEAWSEGQVVMVSGVDATLSQDLWTPQSFERDFGEELADLVDCRNGLLLQQLPSRVFWSGFSKASLRLVDPVSNEARLLKLKDWPTCDDFGEKLPNRYQDLMNALPLQEYTRREGKFNMASSLPSFFVKPDLGPKLYCAYGSAVNATLGTTNLHLDIASAVNVMVYSSVPSSLENQTRKLVSDVMANECCPETAKRLSETGAEVGAIWHIYHAAEADKLRTFLRKVNEERGVHVPPNTDPIHDQLMYLDSDLRERLYREHGVRGWSIAQCPGDAIFIPAGAPHQVRNLRDCIKVALDFVSPEQIGECLTLTEEFRQLSEKHVNREDKLQTRNIIYHSMKDVVGTLKSYAK